VQNKPTSLNGVSAGHEPSQVNNKNTLIKVQYNNRAIGEKLNPLNNKL